MVSTGKPLTNWFSCLLQQLMELDELKVENERQAEVRLPYLPPAIIWPCFASPWLPRAGLPTAQEQKFLPRFDLPEPPGESGPTAGEVQRSPCGPDSGRRGSCGHEEEVSCRWLSLDVSVCVVWGPCGGHCWTQAGSLLEFWFCLLKKIWKVHTICSETRRKK